MTVMMMRFATEEYAERLSAASAVDPAASRKGGSGQASGRRCARSHPGGTTEIEPPEQCRDSLLPGFREAMANGLSFSLWLVTIVTIAATDRDGVPVPMGPRP